MQKLLDTALDNYESLRQKASEIGADLATIDTHKSRIVDAFYYSDFIQRIAFQYCSEFTELLPSLIEFDASNAYQHYALEQLQLNLRSNLRACSDESQAFACIRKCRHLAMLQIAWHDFLNQQDIVDSLKVTSHLANILINESYTYLYASLSEKFGAPELEQPLLILAMGKLGGNELNFSSDIDLIFTYPHSGETNHPRKPLEHQVFFTRLAQRLIKMLDHVTQDGRVFRVDMRLRPLGESGPLVLPFSAFESYYLEQGRQWERFAMQKMRIVNNSSWNTELQSIITPFVYRKYIDFTTIESIREMKHLIEKEVRRKQISGNIKLGKGGIREVEFFVQSLQLIHAGRHPDCQKTSILAAMQALVEAEFLPGAEQTQLQHDYLFLRKVEHHLQAFGDEQTQTLPSSDVNQQRLCKILACQNQEAYLSTIDDAMTRINSIFASLVSDANQDQNASESEQHSDVYDDIWLIDMEQEEFTNACAELFDSTSATLLWDCLSLFRTKVDRSGVSARGVKSINKLMPLILQECKIFEHALNPNQIQGLFGILQTIIGRVTYIDLLLEHPEVRHRLLLLCEKSPWISAQIAQYPLLLDELLHPVYLEEDKLSLSEWKQDCTDQLRQTMLRVDLTDIEYVMDKLREFKHTNQLRIAAADITGSLAINQVSDKLTLLAEVLMHQVIEYAWQQMTELYGLPQGLPVEDKGIALVAYGKFGGIELSYGSDLDIVFLHSADLSKGTDESGSRKQMSNQEFYIKLVQRISHLCTTKTYNGVLYEIDLRLRPSGNSGLLVSHINSFEEYQQHKAWTWEHQALVRSRVICASPSLHDAFVKVRTNIIALPRNTNELKQSVAEMRLKMREHLLKKVDDKIDVKQALGGIVDVEFMVQFWVLAVGESYAKQLHWSDNLRLLAVLREIGSITHEQEQNLCEAYLTLRHSSHRLQLANQKYARHGSKLSKAMDYVASSFKQVFSPFCDD